VAERLYNRHPQIRKTAARRARERYKIAKLQPEIVCCHFRNLFFVHALAQIQRYAVRNDVEVPGFVRHCGKLIFPEQPGDVIDSEVDLAKYNLLYVVANGKVIVKPIDDELQLIPAELMVTFDETPWNVMEVLLETLSTLGKTFPE